MKDDLLRIINNYGIQNQLRKFNEETFELQEAIIKAENKYEPIQDIDHIAEEIADVMVMLKQFQMYYKISRDEIRDVMKYKIERQLERIKNENK